MQINVALLPKLLREPRQQCIAVVDVLRATTSLVAMFDAGLERAIIPDTLRDARALALRHLALLCGEAKALPIAGFDYGNSPAEFAQAPLQGKTAVLWTTNGTKAIAAAAPAPFVTVAAFTNRSAAASRLVQEATARELDITVLCSGLERGQIYALEDHVAAGAVVEAARAAAPEARLSDSAWAALHLWRWYRGDAACVFRHAAHGRILARMGFEADLEFAAHVDVSTTVPALRVDDGVACLHRPMPEAWKHGR